MTTVAESQERVTVLPSAVERAARLAEAMTAEPNTTHHSDDPWTVQDVVNVALARGLDVLERQYLTRAEE